jgi:hypothetical protein
MENEDVIRESVEIMVRAQNYLDGLPKNLQSPDYVKIVELVNSYIETNCKHRIVQDSIDLGPDSSKTIYYCETCYKNMR